MSVFFIKCSIDSIVYLRGETVVNRPVNLVLCKSIQKRNYAWYPDNKGLPAIEFLGCDVTWVYEDVESRDKEFEEISEIQIFQN